MRARRVGSWLVVVACLSSCTTQEPVGPLDGLGPASVNATSPVLVGAGSNVRVEVQATLGGGFGETTHESLAFDVGRLPDGVSISRIGALPAPGGDARFANPVTAPEMVFAARISPSSGAEFFGPDLAPMQIDPQQTARLREDVGLPARPPLSVRPANRARVSGPRIPRLLTPEASAALLRGLRTSGMAEERISESQLRFHLVSDVAQHTLVFDEHVGGVVERTIEREGRPTIHVTNAYHEQPGGFVMISSTSEWINAKGVVERRSVKKYVQ